MKKNAFLLRVAATVVALSLFALTAGCSKMEEGGSESVTKDTVSTSSGEIKIPEIKSDDTIMPNSMSPIAAVNFRYRLLLNR